MNNFKKLQEKVHQFNVYVKENCEEIRNYSIVLGKPINNQEINELEQLTQVKLPEDLVGFYTNLGSISPIGATERNSMYTSTIDGMKKELQAESKYEKLLSMGLIDSIRHSWGNDRYEFDVGEYFSQEQLDTLNRKYYCFGLYRLGDGVEAAGYLYFDEEGKFGSFYYHQDYFEEEVHEELLALLEKSPATLSLEELLINSIQEIQESIEEEL